MTTGCYNEMKRQIQKEIDASMIYLAMGAHFSRDTINRPGFAKFFFDSAAEEREHGLKLIEYLLMRGQLTGKDNDLTKLITVEVSENFNLILRFIFIKNIYYQAPPKTTWENGVEALKDALRKEAEVTKSIRQVIETCEDDAKFNDYHVSFDRVYVLKNYFNKLNLISVG